MEITESLIDGLLQEEESSSLDFKRDQYPFVDASIEQKSELLKDILAFANAWRRDDAFVVIGVQEGQGGRHSIVGLTTHLKDNDLQQFVSSKTQRPVQFRYRAIDYRGSQLGIIHIPLQDRPIFLKQDFGKLRKNVVYLRRGSATDEANPDEIAKMGLSSTRQASELPILDIQFADSEKGCAIGNCLSKSVVNLKVPPDSEIPDYEGKYPTLGGIPYRLSTGGFTNSDYWRELAAYDWARRISVPVYFFATNMGEAPAFDVRLELRFPVGTTGFVAWDEEEFPKKPTPDDFTHRLRHTIGPRPDTIVKPFADEILVEVHLGKLQPKSSYITKFPIYLGAQSAIQTEIVATVFADNLSEPKTIPFKFDFEVSHCNWQDESGEP